MSWSLIGNSARQRATCASPADGIALAAGVGAALEGASLDLPDRAHARARRCEVGHVADDVTEAFEVIADLAPDASFHLQHARLVRVREERPGKALRDHARRLDGGLGIHAEVDDVADDLHHRLALRV